jgi:predicted nucleotidyltransferase
MIEKILGSKVKIKILRFFFEYPLVKRNVREIARECKIGFGISTSALRDLSSSGLIKMEKSGREMIYSLDTSSKLFYPIKQLFEYEKELMGNLPFIYMNLISDIASSTKSIAEACFLFGSLVTGTFTSKSDVDLLFVSSKEEKVRKACMKLEERYGIKLQVIVIRKKDIKNFKKSSLFKTIKKESLVIFDKSNIAGEMFA